MAIVFDATDLATGERVAIKYLRPELAERANTRTRTYREATSLARLEHPNIVRVLDIFEWDRSVAVVLEIVDGGTLADRIARGPLTPREFACVTRGLLEGLNALHVHGMVHRDLKPSNILLRRDGSPALADLGIASDADTYLPRLTRAGATLGTPEYMSPEQIRGEQLDLRSDVYSAGVVLYEMIAGRVPFGGASEYDVKSMQVHEAPDLAPLGDLAPMAVVGAIETALAKSRSDRWPSALDFLSHLGLLDG